jgi:hypothetical protein
MTTVKMLYLVALVVLLTGPRVAFGDEARTDAGPMVSSSDAGTNTLSSDLDEPPVGGPAWSAWFDKYGQYCESVPKGEKRICCLCVESTRPWVTAPTGPFSPYARVNVGALHECREQKRREQQEFEGLRRKIATWQPRGNKDAGDGLEGLDDASLEAVMPSVRPTIQRMDQILSDLGRPRPFSQDKVDEAVAEVGRFVAAEKACRASAKCMAARADRKAEEAFFAEVVSPMCEADKTRETAQADMARERANPSGVVDLNLLHLDGALMAQSEQAIKDATGAYVARRHHPWRGWRSECQ